MQLPTTWQDANGNAAQRHATSYVPELVRRLYAIVGELESHFPGRPFTPDGHLVGSIGEVLAAYRYGLTLLPCSAAGHDARSQDGRLVQIKATQGGKIGLRTSCAHLLVLKLLPSGDTEEIFNGPGDVAWDAAGTMQSNGQRSLSLKRLADLMANVPKSARLAQTS